MFFHADEYVPPCPSVFDTNIFPGYALVILAFVLCLILGRQFPDFPGYRVPSLRLPTTQTPACIPSRSVLNQVERDRETLECPSMHGLFPTGEGAGYAGKEIVCFPSKHGGCVQWRPRKNANASLYLMSRQSRGLFH